MLVYSLRASPAGSSGFYHNNRQQENGYYYKSNNKINRLEVGSSGYNHDVMEVFLVRYGEIALKGGKRDVFEEQLKTNIINSLKIQPDQVRRHRGQFVIHVQKGEFDLVVNTLGKVFGITWYGLAKTCNNDIQNIIKLVLQTIKEKRHKGPSFAIQAQRSDKSLPFTSGDIKRQVGDAVIKLTGWRVQLDKPDIGIQIITSQEGAYVIQKRYDGAGGLPVGTAGKVLVLLSGGFDSLAAAYLMSKRGAQVDYIHFHAFSDTRLVWESKIMKIVKGLAIPTQARKLYLSSYFPFEMEVLNMNWNSRRYEAVVFRRLMAGVAERIAEKYNYQALVMGDSLGQVASQTLENMIMVDNAVSIPIFRPLIGMDKVEIIELVRKIGLYKTSIKKYKDCCSLLSSDPVKAASYTIIKKIEKMINISNIAKKMAKDMEVVDIQATNGVNNSCA